MTEKVIEKSDDQLLQILLFTTNEFNDALSELTENELLRMLKLEVSCKFRKYLIRRIYTRYNKLRGKRELQEILDGNT